MFKTFGFLKKSSKFADYSLKNFFDKTKIETIYQLLVLNFLYILIGNYYSNYSTY